MRGATFRRGTAWRSALHNDVAGGGREVRRSEEDEQTNHGDEKATTSAAAAAAHQTFCGGENRFFNKEKASEPSKVRPKVLH